MFDQIMAAGEPHGLRLFGILGIVLGPFPAVSFDHNRLNAALGRLAQPGSVRPIADNNRDFASWYLATFDGVNQCDHIRPAA